ncbi:hypothetical protein MNBD_BACTEROID05-575, partial [hydrothermal vent metagenome]
MYNLRSLKILVVFLSALFVWVGEGYSQEKVVPAVKEAQEISSKELVRLSWEASSKRDFKRLNELTAIALEHYNEKALLDQSKLSSFPHRGEESKYQTLNDVATCLFIQAEATMNNGKTKEAVELFQNIIKTYPFSQAWDPRGWYWSVSEKSQASIDVLTGKTEDASEKNRKKTVRTKPQLKTIGKSKIVDYSLYGEFLKVGTSEYRYKIKDVDGLAAAVGEGIYPNSSATYNNPRYKIVKAEGRLEGSHWDFINSDDLEAAHFKWVKAPEPWGVRLFYIGMIFEKAGMKYEALRAYHALVVHFPKTVGWTYWQTPWYPGQAAIAKIKHILRVNPELNLKAKWMKIEIGNGFDNEIKNDVIVTWPGKIVPRSLWDQVRNNVGVSAKIALKDVKQTVGQGEVKLIQYANNHWQMTVKNKPYVIKGITYAPTKIGQSPDKG